MTRRVRTRIAPSPTGFLHLGTARTAQQIEDVLQQRVVLPHRRQSARKLPDGWRCRYAYANITKPARIMGNESTCPIVTQSNSR